MLIQIKREYILVFLTNFLFFAFCSLLPALLILFTDNIDIFEAVNLGLIGTSVGAAFRYLFPGLNRAIVYFLLPVFFFLFLTSVYWEPSTFALKVFIFLILLPIGWIVANAFSRENIAHIMTVDMLGAIGGIFAPYWLTHVGLEVTLWILALVSLTISAVGLRLPAKHSVPVLLLCGLIPLFFSEKLLIPHHGMTKRNSRSVLNTLGPDARLVVKRDSSVSRLSIYRSEELFMGTHYHIYFNNMLWAGVENSKIDPRYQIRTDAMDNALVIGVGGGKDIWLLKNLGFTNIEAVEIHGPLLEELSVNKELVEYSDSVMSQARFYHDEGRRFIRNSTKKYDYISMQNVDISAERNAPVFFSENYIYTREAFLDYFDKLEDDGVLLMGRGVFEHWKRYSTGHRLINTIQSVLREMGGSPERQILLFKTPSLKRSLMTQYAYYAYVKKTSWSPEEIKSVKDQLSHHVQVYPRQESISLSESEGLLIGLLEGDAEVLSRFKNNQIAIDPSSDDHPFFFYLEKIRKNIPREYKNTLVFIGMFVSVILLILAFLSSRAELRPVSLLFHLFLVSLVGLGSGIFQNTLAVYLSLPVGHQGMAASIVLSTVMVTGLLAAIFFKKRGLFLLIQASVVPFLILFSGKNLSHFSYFLGGLGFWGLVSILYLIFIPFFYLCSCSFLLALGEIKFRRTEWTPFVYALSTASLVAGVFASHGLMLVFGVSLTLISSALSGVLGAGLLFCISQLRATR